VGTDKRERQKANRRQRLEEIARQSRNRKTKRRALQFGIGIPLAIVVLFVAVRLFGDGDDSSGSPSVTTAAAPSTTVATGPVDCPPAEGSSVKYSGFTEAPPMCIDPAKSYSAVVETNLGSYTIQFDAAAAPQTVNNFVFLARYHYFDDTPCHRIIPGFVVQCGSPDGSGNGGPGYEFADELPAAGQYKIGSVAMANSGADTNGSQFFVVSGDSGASLDPNYSLFGQVTDGLDTTIKALDAVGTPGSGTPTQPVTILSVKVTESDSPTAPTSSATATTQAATTTAASTTS
jgi:cyclophilin family peptidyl-prolyl cis-trans isomerase